MLTEQRRQQLDGIVKQMIANKESDSNIQFVVSDFSQKYGNEQQPQQQKTFGQKAGDVVSGVGNFLGLGSLGKGLANVTFDVAGRTGILGGTTKDLINSVENGTATPEQYKAYAEIYGSMPTKGQVIGSAIQTGANVLSAGIGTKALTSGGRIASMGLQSTAVGGALGLGQGLEQKKTLGESTKQGLLTGLATGVVGSGIQGVGELAKLLTASGVRESIVNKTLKIPTKVIEKGKSPAPRILEEGIMGTKKGIVAKSEKIITDTNNQIQNVLKGNKTPINSNKIVETIKNKLTETYGLVLSPEEIDNVVLKLPLNELRKNQQISVETLNKVRQVIDNQYLGSTKWLNNSSAENITALKTAANVMRNIVKGTAPETNAMFSKLADYITTKNSLVKDLAKPHALTQILEGLGSAMAGIGSGGFSPEGATKAIAYYGLLKAFLSTPSQLGIAQGLKVGEKVAESAITKGAGKITNIGIQQATKNIIK